MTPWHFFGNERLQELQGQEVSMLPNPETAVACGKEKSEEMMRWIPVTEQSAGFSLTWEAPRATRQCQHRMISIDFFAFLTRWPCENVLHNLNLLDFTRRADVLVGAAANEMGWLKTERVTMKRKHEWNTLILSYT